MGRLVYGPQQRTLEIEDRVLAHLKIVILSKLRRRESFAFSWENPASEGSGRGSIWLSTEIPLEFQFTDEHGPLLNRAWIQQLSALADRGELQVTDEPVERGPHGSEQTAYRH